jgi:hypothetical protein
VLLAGSVAASVALAADTPEHELRVGAALTLAPGARGAASLTIVPAAGRRLDPDAPLSLRLSVAPADGLKLPRRRYALADAADPRAEAPRFDLAVEALAPGSYTVSVDARFWLCAAHTCRAVRDHVELPVTVEAVPTP